MYLKARSEYRIQNTEFYLLHMNNSSDLQIQNMKINEKWRDNNIQLHEVDNTRLIKICRYQCVTVPLSLSKHVLEN